MEVKLTLVGLYQGLNEQNLGHNVESTIPRQNSTEFQFTDWFEKAA